MAGLERTIKVRTDAELYAELDRRAGETGLSLSAYCRWIWRRHLLTLTTTEGSNTDDQPDQ